MATTQKDVYDNLIAIDPEYMSYEKFQEKMKNPKHVESIRQYLESVNVPVSDSSRFFEKYATKESPYQQMSTKMSPELSQEDIYRKQTEQMIGYPRNEMYDKTAQTLFPRTSKTNPIFDPAKQQLTSLGLDLVSLPGRHLASLSKAEKETIQDVVKGGSIIDALLNVPERYVESFGMTRNEPKLDDNLLDKGFNFFNDMARHPASIIPGPGRLGSVGSKLVEAVRPGTMLAAREAIPAALQGLGRLAAESGTQVAIGEADRIAAGKDFGEGTGVEYGLEAGLGGLTGIIPGIRSFAKESVAKDIGNVYNYNLGVMGADALPTRLQAEQKLEQLLDNLIQQSNHPNIKQMTQNVSLFDKARTVKEIIKKSPHYAGNRQIGDFLNDILAGQITGSPAKAATAYLAGYVPIVGKPISNVVAASALAPALSNIPRNVQTSSLQRGLGATLLDNLENDPKRDVTSTLKR